MAKRITTIVLALALCLALVPAQSFAVSAPKEAIIKEAPVFGERAFNQEGLGVIESDNGTRYLIDRDGAIYREGKAWMDYGSDAEIYVVDGEGYYGFPNGETLFTMEQLEANIKAFLEEHYPIGEVADLELGATYPFSGLYVTCSFKVEFKDGDQSMNYESYTLIDQAGLVHYMPPLMDRTSGGGFLITYALSECKEGLVRFTKEYHDWEDNYSVYEIGYKYPDGDDALVFSYGSNRDPEDGSVIVIDGTGYSSFDDFHNGVAVVKNDQQKYSLINRDGKVLLPFEYDNISNEVGSYLIVQDYDKGYGYMDTAGVIVIPQEYEFAQGSWDNIFVVKKDGKYGVVNTDNETVVPFEYDFMSNPDKGVVYANKGSKAYIITFKDVDETLTPQGTKKVSALFYDIPEDYGYKTYLQNAYDSNIIGGKKDDQGRAYYDPKGGLKHGEIMVMVAQLHAAMKGEKFTPAPDLTDHWARPYCEYCKSEGIIDERFDEAMLSDAFVNRAEMAYYFAHALDKEYYKDKVTISFSDMPENGYDESIMTLAKAGIVGGFPNGTYRPEEGVTREQAVVFISNILDALAGK